MNRYKPNFLKQGTTIMIVILLAIWAALYLVGKKKPDPIEFLKLDIVIAHMANKWVNQYSHKTKYYEGGEFASLTYYFYDQKNNQMYTVPLTEDELMLLAFQTNKKYVRLYKFIYRNLPDRLKKQFVNPKEDK